MQCSVMCSMILTTREMRIASAVLLPLVLGTAARSPKKGMVIPNWPAHYCRDWDNMEEHVRCLDTAARILLC